MRRATSQRPDRPTIETLEVFSNQASLVIESQLKVHGLKSQLTTIQDDLELAQQTAERAQSHLPVLLHKDLEQTDSHPEPEPARPPDRRRAKYRRPDRQPSRPNRRCCTPWGRKS